MTGRMMLLVGVTWGISGCCAVGHAYERNRACDILTQVSSVSSTSVIVDEFLTPRLFPKETWNVSLNDEVVARFDAKHLAAVDRRIGLLRLALQLRPGNNVIQATLGSTEGTDYCRKTIYWMFRPEPRRFAILVHSPKRDGESDQLRLSQIREQLVQAGLPPDDIFVANSLEEAKDKINKAVNQITRKDEILFYYSGASRKSAADLLPVLDFGSDGESALAVADVIQSLLKSSARQVSVVLDSPSAQDWSSTPLNVDSADLNQPLASFAGRLSMFAADPEQSIELLVRSGLDSPAGSRLSPLPSLIDVIGQGLRSPSRTVGCVTLKDTVATWRNSAGEAGAHELYLNSSTDNLSFCLKPDSREVAVEAALQVLPNSAAFPRKEGWVSLRVRAPQAMHVDTVTIAVDGVPIRQLLPFASEATASIDEPFTLSQGTHLIEVAGTTLGSPTFTRYLTMSREAGGPALVAGYYAKPSHLLAKIESPTRDGSSVGADHVMLGIVAGNSHRRSVSVEVRNRGVVVLQANLRKEYSDTNVALFHDFPLSAGNNLFTLEVSDGDAVATVTRSVVGRSIQPIKALLVASDQHENAPDVAAGRDIDLMANLLLRYTDLVPRNMTILRGSNATWGNVLASVMNESGELTQQRGPELLFFGYAGPGATAVGKDGSKHRCLFLYDSSITNLERTCLRLDMIQDSLSKWPRTLSVIDTSYDGLSGTNQSTGLLSRTLTPAFYQHQPQGLAAAATNLDHVYLLATSPNSPALIDKQSQNGVFTDSWNRSLESFIKRTPNEGNSDTHGPTAEAVFTAAQLATVKATAQIQTPYSVGISSVPFRFRNVPTGDLLLEADSLVSEFSRVREERRSRYPNHLEDAHDIYDKVIALEPDDSEAIRGVSRVKLLEAHLEWYRASDNSAQDPSSGAAFIADLEAELTKGVRGASDDRQRSEWLALRTELRLRQGRLGEALTDAAEASRLAPDSPERKLALALLYVLNGHDERAVPLFDSLLRTPGPGGGQRSPALSEDDVNRLVLWTYMSRMRLGHRTEARALLTLFAIKGNRTTGIFSNVLGKALLSGSYKGSILDSGYYQREWSHEVARYLLLGSRESRRMENFQEQSIQAFNRSIPKWAEAAPDPEASSLLVHFYLGVGRDFSKDNVAASREFKTAVATEQFDYPEYWLAVRRLKELALH